MAFLEQQKLVALTGSGNWVLSRDLSHYPVQQLLSHSPWPLPRVENLPEQLDEHWYPALRSGLEQLQEEQASLFSADLGQWLQPQGHSAE